MAADALAPYMVISIHKINYIKLIGPCLLQGRILTSCIILDQNNCVKCKYAFVSFSSKQFIM